MPHLKYVKYDKESTSTGEDIAGRASKNLNC